MLITKENHAFFKERAKLAKQRRLIQAQQVAAQAADFIGSCPASWLSALDEQHAMLKLLLAKELAGQGPPNGRPKRIRELLACQRLMIEQRQKLTGEPSTFSPGRTSTVRPLGASAPAKVGVRSTDSASVGRQDPTDSASVAPAPAAAEEELPEVPELD